MNPELVKSLSALIDETLEELEDLKKSKLSKSERLSATEVKLGADEGLAGKDKNGSIEGAKKAEKEDESEEKKEKKDEAKEEVAKAEDKKEDKKDEKKDEAKAEDKAEDKKEDKELPFKKSLDEQETLLKSYVDSKISGLEGRLSEVLVAVQKLADAPVAPKGFTAKDVVPLVKSAETDSKVLSKAEVVNKLLELKKSNSQVDSADVAKAELGLGIEGLVKKYNL